MVLNETLYNWFKWLIQIFLPAFGAAYFALSDLWNLPSALQVVGTCSVVAIFLGAILGISTKNYEKKELGIDGSLVVKDDGDGATWKLNLSDIPENLEQKQTITLKIDKEGIDPPEAA